jgi:hypothetical protein
MTAVLVWRDRSSAIAASGLEPVNRSARMTTEITADIYDLLLSRDINRKTATSTGISAGHQSCQPRQGEV